MSAWGHSWGRSWGNSWGGVPGGDDGRWPLEFTAPQGQRAWTEWEPEYELPIPATPARRWASAKALGTARAAAVGFGYLRSIVRTARPAKSKPAPRPKRYRQPYRSLMTPQSAVAGGVARRFRWAASGVLGSRAGVMRGKSNWHSPERTREDDEMVIAAIMLGEALGV